MASEAGFARLGRRLDVVLERTDHAEEDVRRLREDHDQDITDLRAAVEDLKRARWPLPSVAALTGLAALVLTLYELAAR
ncbi:hypothetical protein ADL27_30115 [Streptomyces sp. NRRL F-6602]|nr:hypothetical protein ADL27_30115 [Streptomyces sp. NRRL F-6602]